MLRNLFLPIILLSFLLSGCQPATQGTSTVSNFDVQTPVALPSYYECKPIESWMKKTYPDNYRAPVPRKEAGNWVYDYAYLYEDDPDIYVYSDHYMSRFNFKMWARNKQSSTQERNFRTVKHSSYDCMTFPGYKGKHKELYKSNAKLTALALDVFILVKKSKGMPVFKVGIKPINFEFSEYPELQTVSFHYNGDAHSHINKPYFWSLNDTPFKNVFFDQIPYSALFVSLKNLSAPDRSGIQFTEWRFCRDCMLTDIQYKNRDPGMYARDLEKNYSLTTAGFDREKSTHTDHLLASFKGLEKSKIPYIPTYDPFGLMPIDVNFSTQDYSQLPSGEQAFQSAAKLGIEYYGSIEANELYEDFVQNEYRPMTMRHFLKTKAFCGSIDHYMVSHDSPSEIRAVARQWEARANCLLEKANEYDAAAYAERLTYLKGKEDHLYKQTVGVKREVIESLEAQFNHASSRVNENMTYADQAYADARTARQRDREYEEREQRVKQQWLNTIQMLSQPQQQKRTVTPTSYSSTTGTHTRTGSGLTMTNESLENTSYETSDFKCLNHSCTHYCENGYCNTAEWEAANQKEWDAHKESLEGWMRPASGNNEVRGVVSE